MKFDIKYSVIRSKGEDYQKVAYSLMSKLMTEMAQATMIFDNSKYNFFEVPYNTNERRLDAILLPALSKICKGLVMTEVPTERKPNKAKDGEDIEEHNGRIDYWCIYKDYSFVIELKHSMEYIGSSKLRKSTLDSWQVMKKQLSTIRLDVAQFCESTKNVIPLGIHLVTFYSNPQCKKRLAEIKEHPQLIFDEVKPQTKSNFQAIWMLPDKLIEDECTYTQIDYPSQAFAMLAYIDKPIKHHGRKEYLEKHKIE